LPEPVSLVVIDVSFISLKLILPAVANWFSAAADVVALIKPQFEAGREAVGKGGIVRDPRVHRMVLDDLLGWAVARGLGPQAIIRSPIQGADGNVEYLVWLRPSTAPANTSSLIESALAQVD